MPTLIATADMPLAIDNDIFTHIRNRKPYVMTYVAKYFADTQKFPAIAAVTAFETTYGFQKALVMKKQTEAETIERQKVADALFLRAGILLPFDNKASQIAAYVFARLTNSERSKHWRDLFTVATALSHDHGLATQNKKDVELIAQHLPPQYQLRLANWKQP